MRAPLPRSTILPEKRLYQRLGGYDVIAAVVIDLFTHMAEHPRLARFGAGRSLDSRSRGRQLTIDQLCALTGGPCVYIGRDMKTAHAGLGITEEDWKSMMELTTASLDKNGVPQKEKEELLAIFASFKDDIVEVD
ncbi:MAG TPA: group 1 truncated hemoglobin [Terriglobia bacterium]|nr:group 1 truncated hemoglobin [Terriglobia bacterium]